MLDANTTRMPMDAGFSVKEKDMPRTPAERAEVLAKPILQAIGSLNWATHTRFDIITALHVLARNMSNPCMKTWTGIRQLLKYVGSTRERPLIFPKCKEEYIRTITMFVDASFQPDFASNGKSVTCLLIFVGASLVLFETRSQSIPVLSSTHAEIVAMATAIRRVHFVEDLLLELGFECRVIVYEDNQSCMRNFNSLQIADCSKCVRTKHWFNRYAFAKPHWSLRKINTKFQFADVGTRPLEASKFIGLWHLIDTFDPSINYSDLPK